MCLRSLSAENIENGMAQILKTLCTDLVSAKHGPYQYLKQSHIITYKTFTKELKKMDLPQYL